MKKCVNCDECEFRSESVLCEISENEDTCPLANLDDFSSCVVGLTFDKTPIISYNKMVEYLSDVEDASIEESKAIIDYNHIAILETFGTKPIIMHDR